jgi:phosphatidylglycerol:prolipoprotein diacylglycerol transferase
LYPFISDILRDLFGFESPIEIFSFGFMVAVAVLVAGWLLQKELDRMYRADLIGGVLIRNPEKSRKGSGKRDAGGEELLTVSPSHLVGTITVLTIFVGFAGAKAFHILENTSQFAADPWRMIVSSGGFTFYGGMIMATVVIMWYVRSKNLSMLRVADAAAPGLMLAYGIGRIGCYLAGDGDWGVCSDLAEKPSWLPAALWSETFDRNLLGPNRQPIDVLEYMNCPPAADGVYPTMLYEFAMAVAIFLVLWSIRKHRHAAGWLFGVYLIFNGLERFAIEQIRVNNVGSLLGMQVTQAEVIAVLVAVVGVAVAVFARRGGDSGG